MADRAGKAALLSSLGKAKCQLGPRGTHVPLSPQPYCDMRKDNAASPSLGLTVDTPKAYSLAHPDADGGPSLVIARIPGQRSQLG